MQPASACQSCQFVKPTTGRRVPPVRAATHAYTTPANRRTLRRPTHARISYCYTHSSIRPRAFMCYRQRHRADTHTTSNSHTATATRRQLHPRAPRLLMPRARHAFLPCPSLTEHRCDCPTRDLLWRNGVLALPLGRGAGVGRYRTCWGGLRRRHGHGSRRHGVTRVRCSDLFAIYSVPLFCEPSEKNRINNRQQRYTTHLAYIVVDTSPHRTSVIAHPALSAEHPPYTTHALSPWQDRYGERGPTARPASAGADPCIGSRDESVERWRPQLRAISFPVVWL